MDRVFHPLENNKSYTPLLRTHLYDYCFTLEKKLKQMEGICVSTFWTNQRWGTHVVPVLTSSSPLKIRKTMAGGGVQICVIFFLLSFRCGMH